MSEFPLLFCAHIRHWRSLVSVLQVQQWVCWSCSRTSRWDDSTILPSRNAKRNWRKCRTCWWLTPLSSQNWGSRWFTTKLVTSVCRSCFPYAGCGSRFHHKVPSFIFEYLMHVSLHLLEFVVGLHPHVKYNVWPYTHICCYMCGIVSYILRYVFELYLYFKILSNFCFLKNILTCLNESGQQNNNLFGVQSINTSKYAGY